MIPAPAPNARTPIVCAATIAGVNAAQLGAYSGPHGERHALFVATDEPFAYVSWGVGDEGGQSVYRHAGGRWCRIANGGGAMNEHDLAAVVGAAHARRLWVKARGTHR
jgi:hypothetical protein